MDPIQNIIKTLTAPFQAFMPKAQPAPRTQNMQMSQYTPQPQAQSAITANQQSAKIRLHNLNPQLYPLDWTNSMQESEAQGRIQQELARRQKEKQKVDDDALLYRQMQAREAESLRNKAIIDMKNSQMQNWVNQQNAAKNIPMPGFEIRFG